jgi:soluble lytic murein transglycosylase-like protein
MARADYELIARNASTKWGVPFELIAGVIQTESAWNAGARSSAGAQGLMQLMPKTFTWLGYNLAAILDPATNIDAGTKYLSQMLDRYNGSWALAAMAYNGGPGTVDSAIKRAGSSDPDAVSRQIKAAETRAYWAKVLNWAAAFAGKITTTEARAAAAVAEVSEDVKSWATSGTGILLLGLIAAGLIIGVSRG